MVVATAPRYAVRHRMGEVSAVQEIIEARRTKPWCRPNKMTNDNPLAS